MGLQTRRETPQEILQRTTRVGDAAVLIIAANPARVPPLLVGGSVYLAWNDRAIVTVQ
jgi:hypothetical protein